MKVFYRFLKSHFRFNTYYKLRFFTEFLRDALMMYSYYALWNVMYDAGMGYDGSTRVQLLTYGVVGGLVTTFITRDGCQRYIRERINKGTVDGDLVKPMGLQTHLLARDLGIKLAKLLQFTLPTLAIFVFVTKLYYLPTLKNLLLFLVSFGLAYLVLFSINYLFGMLCFVTLSIENIYFCYTAVVCFLAGQFVPLWMFPDWARRVVNLLPFRCIYDIPMSIYVGRISVEEALNGIGLQFFWAALLWICGMAAWKSIKKHVISQGG